MENEVKKEGQVYEIGYLLLPSIPAEKVGTEVEAIKSLVSKNGGQMIAEEFPQLRQLSYVMQKQVGATRHKVNEGYFGWVKFEIATDGISAIKTAFDTNDKVLRYLLIKTVRENTYLGQKAAVIAKEEPKEEVKAEEAGEMSVEEIDKTIDDMVKEA